MDLSGILQTLVVWTRHCLDIKQIMKCLLKALSVFAQHTEQGQTGGWKKNCFLRLRAVQSKDISKVKLRSLVLDAL